MEEKLTTRRKVLIGMTAAVGSAGIPFAAVPFLSAWNPSAKAKAVGAPVKVDISKIQVGQKIQVAWRKQPVFVIRHSKEALANLSQIEEKLDDPQSNNIDEPYRDINPTRSTSNEFTVIAGVCTHLGCSPLYKPNAKSAELGLDWNGGFFCPCHGSKFDLSGRVHKSMPAPSNLEVPPYYFASDNKIIVGEDGEKS